MISQRVHLGLAFAWWLLVGIGLFVAGGIFLFGSSPSLLHLGGVALALALGYGKSRMLDKMAGKNIIRIRSLPETSSLAATFSGKTWLLIVLMIVLGRTLRALGTPRPLLGVVYLAVGFALALSSRVFASAARSV